jgi:hypothetical protein
METEHPTGAWLRSTTWLSDHVIAMRRPRGNRQALIEANGTTQ